MIRSDRSSNWLGTQLHSSKKFKNYMLDSLRRRYEISRRELKFSLRISNNTIRVWWSNSSHSSPRSKNAKLSTRSSPLSWCFQSVHLYTNRWSLTLRFHNILKNAVYASLMLPILWYVLDAKIIIAMYVLPLSNKIPENVVIVIMLTSSYLVILYYIGMKFICV